MYVTPESRGPHRRARALAAPLPPPRSPRPPRALSGVLRRPRIQVGSRALQFGRARLRRLLAGRRRHQPAAPLPPLPPRLRMWPRFSLRPRRAPHRRDQVFGRRARRRRVDEQGARRGVRWRRRREGCGSPPVIVERTVCVSPAAMAAAASSGYASFVKHPVPYRRMHAFGRAPSFPVGRSRPAAASPSLVPGASSTHAQREVVESMRAHSNSGITAARFDASASVAVSACHAWRLCGSMILPFVCRVRRTHDCVDACHRSTFSTEAERRSR